MVELLLIPLPPLAAVVITLKLEGAKLMHEVFNCHTGRTVAYLPRPLARIAADVLSRLTGRTFDHA